MEQASDLSALSATLHQLEGDLEVKYKDLTSNENFIIMNIFPR